MRPHTRSGHAVREFNGNHVVYIDKLPTVLLSIHCDIAKGYIINNDLTTSPCYVARGQGYFAHGDTVETAVHDLEDKIIANMSSSEKNEKFKSCFELDTAYGVSEFFKWHNTLTGSCEMGRLNFMHNHGIKMEDTVTTRRFFELTKDDFGSSIIHELAQAYDLKL